MPDPNKLAKLEEQGYALQLGCCLCKHGSFVAGSHFGSCWKTFYQHAKHVNEKPLSVHRAGTCPLFEADPERMSRVRSSGFDRFLPKDKS